MFDLISGLIWFCGIAAAFLLPPAWPVFLALMWVTLLVIAVSAARKKALNNRRFGR